jgi:Fe-S cluster biogenesis protein NfuA
VTKHDDPWAEESARIERLLDELERSAGPQTWPRVEALMQAVVGLYGEGLRRLVERAGDLAASAADDALVGSLLLLHGLHPLPPAARVARALDRVRPYLGSHAGDVELLALRDDGVVVLRLLGSCQGCPSSQATVRDLLTRAIQEAAPEVSGVEVQGASPPARSAAALVQVAEPGPAPVQVTEPAPRWIDIGGDLPEGGRRSLDMDGVPVLLLRVGAALVAYRDACAGCGGPLRDAPLDGGLLACPKCARRFDVGRGGRDAADPAVTLEPLPLLGTRVAVRPR